MDEQGCLAVSRVLLLPSGLTADTTVRHGDHLIPDDYVLQHFVTCRDMVLMVENVHIAFFFVVNIASCMQRKGAFDQML
jgi:hypothetical protein